jgi:hypothetical protein
VGYINNSGESTENCKYLFGFEAKFDKLLDPGVGVRWSLFMKKWK